MTIFINGFVVLKKDNSELISFPCDDKKFLEVMNAIDNFNSSKDEYDNIHWKKEVKVLLEILD